MPAQYWVSGRTVGKRFLGVCKLACEEVCPHVHILPGPVFSSRCPTFWAGLASGLFLPPCCLTALQTSGPSVEPLPPVRSSPCLRTRPTDIVVSPGTGGNPTEKSGSFLWQEFERDENARQKMTAKNCSAFFAAF